MWFLFFFQFLNNNLTEYQIDQFSTEIMCEAEKKKAVVLITGSTTTLHCFEAKPKG